MTGPNSSYRCSDLADLLGRIFAFVQNQSCSLGLVGLPVMVVPGSPEVLVRLLEGYLRTWFECMFWQWIFFVKDAH